MRHSIIVVVILGVASMGSPLFPFSKGESGRAADGDAIELPQPQVTGQLSVEEAIQSRRSVRDYTDESLKLEEVAQLLWAAQGITQPTPYGLRSAPSAGALYPLEIYLFAGLVDGLQPGIYKYRPHSHDLVKVVEGDQRKALCRGALSQECISEAPAVFVIAAVYQRVMKKYGERGVQYTHVEVGAAAENIYLQCESLGLGTVIVGAFSDDRVSGVCHLAKDEAPLAILPVGRPR